MKGLGDAINAARKEVDEIRHLQDEYRALAGHHNRFCTCSEIY